tara:strand:+ start:490 stop:963 length:474 start_codon:yes stop_codon:yes gene_type:complete
MEDTWKTTRDKCVKFDISSAITETIDVIKEGNYWEELDTQTEIQALIRQHFSHTSGDSGIPNMMHRVASPEKVIFEGAKEVLDMTFEMLVQRIDSNHYDARDITEEGLYNWRHFYHDGSEFEAIHIAILMFGDDDLRTDWSRVLSEAFMISRRKANN